MGVPGAHSLQSLAMVLLNADIVQLSGNDVDCCRIKLVAMGLVR